uniref:RxLR effector protein n=1 Tax=Phytophthora sojae TaxID=67593 RepID=E0W4X3_PHYSO|nr:Avh265 [Phytophthora sojae]AEK81072.1 Avh265 [Phytophthora sojae]AEK81073.1 Avh265 [Phytophthora sojae]
MRVLNRLLLGATILASIASVSAAADTKQTQLLAAAHSTEATLSGNTRFLRSHKTQKMEAAEDEERSVNELAAKLDDVLNHVKSVKDLSLNKAMHHLQMARVPFEKHEAIQRFVTLDAAERKIVLDMIVANNAARRAVQ